MEFATSNHVEFTKEHTSQKKAYTLFPDFETLNTPLISHVCNRCISLLKKTVNKDNGEKILISCLNSDHFRLTGCDTCFLEYLSHTSKFSCGHEKLRNGTYISCKPRNIFAANNILCQCES